VWHEPLPLEFAREPAALRALLGAALTAADVEKHPCEFPSTVRILTTKRHALVIGVNESSGEISRPLDVGALSTGLRIPAGLTQLLFIDRLSGEIVARM
jgi:hypothetical protein